MSPWLRLRGRLDLHSDGGPVAPREAPIYVVVAQNDKTQTVCGEPYNDPNGPIVWEQYTRTASLRQNATTRRRASSAATAPAASRASSSRTTRLSTKDS